MPPFRRRSHEPITANTPLEGGASDGRRINVSDLSFDQEIARVARGLQVLRARQEADWPTVEIQLVLRHASPQSYRGLREQSSKLLGRSGYSTHNWPQTLPPDHSALLVAPYCTGKIGPAIRGARLVAEPAFVVGALGDQSTVPLACAQQIANWIHWTPNDVTDVLAVPVLETLRGGTRVHSRLPFDLGLQWPLPLGDGPLVDPDAP